MAYGASREEWMHFSRTLGLVADLLPVVSNPDAPIDPSSQLGKPGKDGRLPKPGKVPSLFTSERLVVGLPRWTQMQVSQKAVNEWRLEPDYGICIQTRVVRAIDVDVPNRALAARYRAEIEDVLGCTLPERYRADTGKFLLTFEFDEKIVWPKRRLPVEGGVIEFLGDGQQFVAVGTHPDGARYEWMGGVPSSIPRLPLADIERLWARLVLVHAEGEPAIARAPGKRLRIAESVDDPRYDWLVDNWTVFDTGADDQLFLECPFEGEHSSDSGISSTAYFPAGRGGYVDEDGVEQVYQRGHWRCLHAHCEGRSDADFDQATGFGAAAFPNLPALAEPEDPESDTRPEEEGLSWRRNAKGQCEWTSTILITFLSDAQTAGRWIAYDHFLDQIVWAPAIYRDGRQPWRAFGDEHYVDLRLRLEGKGFYNVPKETLRESVYYAARKHPIDTAMEWLARVHWDGKPRIDTFFSEYFGVPRSPYIDAVGAYTWTALAGRVITPGVQADMSPVLIGGQGTRKSSAILAMSPSESAYVKINLAGRDDDLSRKLRGKLIGEFDELRGLATRDSEDIKAWMTQRVEEWVPKFKEFGTNFKRRLLFMGSGNRRGFLADPTGERRWLPMEMPKRGQIDVERIAADRDQLWAEGAVRYRASGIAWQHAEALAREEHAKFKVRDVWHEYVSRWLVEPSLGGTTPALRGFTMSEVITGALQMPSGNVRADTALRVERVLTNMGFTEGEDAVWRRRSRLLD